MSIKFSKEENEVMCNIIGAVESGGMIYGNRDYGAFAEVGENTPNEVSITLGWAQNYGVEAHELVSRIQKADPSTFRKLDTAGIASDLTSSNWSNYDVKKNSSKGQCLIKIITSNAGKKCQDELFAELCQTYINHAEKLGVTDHTGLAECINMSHQGGTGATERVLRKTSKPYNVDTIYAAMQTDTNPSYVGYYKNRQNAVYKWIKQYWPSTNNNITNTTTGGKSNMSKTYPAGYLSNSGHDENYDYQNGQAGDQTATEWEIRSWYSYPWDCVLRHPNVETRKLIAELAIEAALNDKIGYDQYQRTTFWYQLAKANYRPANINTACESDCSAGVSAICKAVGYLINDSKLKNISIDNWTGIMKSNFKSAGFEVLTASKYLTSSDYLCAGDILLNQENHVCTCISPGTKSGESPTVYDGSTTTTANDPEEKLNTTVRTNIYANKNNVKLHTWAGREYSQLKSYPVVNKNQVLGLCDTVKDNDGSAWYFVKIDDVDGGKYGFVYSGDTSNTPVKTPTQSELDDDNTVTVNGVKMTLSDGNSFNTKKRKWVGKVNVDKGQTLNLRQWPNGELLKTLPKVRRGTKVYVYDAILDEDDDIWLYIKTKNPTTGMWTWGFAYAEYIEKI